MRSITKAVGAIIAATLFLQLAPAAEPDAPSPDPARQFDFWCGSWSIDNQRILPTGEHRSGPATLTVRPILRGNAILEQAWEGAPETDMADTFGMSLRYYDATLQRWVVILAWPGGDPVAARFGRMEGAFIDVGGDLQCHLYKPDAFTAPGFHPPDEFTSRFIFSEATPTSLRWQLELPWNGRLIKPWDMHFTRTADPIPASTPLEIKQPPKDCACEQPEARSLDWLVGEWTALRPPAADAQRADAPAPQPITLRASSATRGCATCISIARGATQERFAVIAYVPNDDNWQAHSLDNRTRHAAWQGTWDPDTATLHLTATDDSHPDRTGETLTLSRNDDNALSITIKPPASPASLETNLTRAAP